MSDKQKASVSLFIPQAATTYSAIRERARHAEKLGYRGYWVVDHVMAGGAPDLDFLDGQASPRSLDDVQGGLHDFRTDPIAASYRDGDRSLVGGRRIFMPRSSRFSHLYASLGKEYGTVSGRHTRCWPTPPVSGTLSGPRRPGCRVNDPPPGIKRGEGHSHRLGCSFLPNKPVDR